MHPKFGSNRRLNSNLNFTVKTYRGENSLEFDLTLEFHLWLSHWIVPRKRMHISVGIPSFILVISWLAMISMMISMI